MGPTRAFLTIRSTFAATVYVNHEGLASSFLDKLVAILELQPSDLALRQEVCAATLEAHQQLNEVNGKAHHNMGCSLAAARPQLPTPVASGLRKLQRLSNMAKHVWSPVLSAAVPQTPST
eukprot:12100716-Prorocentrum_lima.AAC.1